MLEVIASFRSGRLQPTGDTPAGSGRFSAGFTHEMASLLLEGTGVQRALYASIPASLSAAAIVCGFIASPSASAQQSLNLFMGGFTPAPL